MSSKVSKTEKKIDRTFDQMIAELDAISGDLLSDEKINFIETECRTVLKSQVDARDDLKKEAHTTLNWIYGLFGLATSFGVKLIDMNSGFLNQRWWLLLPLIFVLTCTGIAAILLFTKVIKTVDCLGMGNEPQNLLIKDFVERDLKWMKIIEIAGWQQRIRDNIDRNETAGDAINLSRKLLLFTPAIFIACLFFCLGLFWISLHSHEIRAALHSWLHYLRILLFSLMIF
ncbi:MAG: hypothetical protein QM796_00250 [Chthoniobacteraceae bacterium]